MKNEISTVHSGNLAGRAVAAAVKSFINMVKERMTAPAQWVSEFLNGLVSEAKA